MYRQDWSMLNKWCYVAIFENVKGPPNYAEACKWFLKLKNMLDDTSAENILDDKSAENI